MTEKGKLYIVATPIGNMADITLRALDILKSVDVIAAEDTRRTGKLLSHYRISTKLVSCHEHNEADRIPGLVDKLKQNASVALVSDAGTPSVSDPGYRLVKAAIENHITVVPIPGPSAIIAALSVSGLPTDTFLFAGFLPKKKRKRFRLLESLSVQPQTLMFYESPKRVPELIADIRQTMGDRYGVLSREMTKIHEEFLRGNLSEILSELKERATVKGECTLLVAGCEKSEASEISIEQMREEIKIAMEKGNLRLSDLSKDIAGRYGISRKMVYAEALKVRSEE